MLLNHWSEFILSSVNVAQQCEATVVQCNTGGELGAEYFELLLNRKALANF